MMLVRVPVMMMPVVSVYLHRDGASGLRDRATDVLELHGGVRDVELRLEYGVQTP
jgi:hypothetical protein